MTLGLTLTRALVLLEVLELGLVEISADADGVFDVACDFEVHAEDEIVGLLENDVLCDAAATVALATPVGTLEAVGKRVATDEADSCRVAIVETLARKVSRALSVNATLSEMLFGAERVADIAALNEMLFGAENDASRVLDSSGDADSVNSEEDAGDADEDKDENADGDTGGASVTVPLATGVSVEDALARALPLLSEDCDEDALSLDETVSAAAVLNTALGLLVARAECDASAGVTDTQPLTEAWDAEEEAVAADERVCAED